ncbi:sigma factor-like helix-turn-helix DNA-binding protein [Micromonospora sp. DT47]|uniref:sigma factor-like helix-turn-helix DNA-binding protein n=1 Tax=Micromonospora sp. DT47 TaxID=3393431 RepID=UPI003CE7A41F
MRWKRSFEGLDSLVAERGSALLATAVLLTGSRAAGEDLLQAALERLMRHWNRIHGNKEGFLRRTMYHLAVDQWRSRKRRPEVLVDVEPPGQSDGTDVLHLRQALIQGLGLLPPRQRAVLVLRYWEQFSEAEAAERCSGALSGPSNQTPRGGCLACVRLWLPGRLTTSRPGTEREDEH